MQRTGHPTPPPAQKAGTHRRGIATPPLKPKTFPFALPTSPMGSFTLLDEHLLLGSAACSSPFPNGEFSFVEDKIGPPSRAYRKLWEALLYAGSMPRPGDICLDAGASPGGWTWALAGLGAKVVAVDRAALDEKVAALPGVNCVKHDAFTLKPGDIGPVDWLMLRCHLLPGALFDWVSSWRLQAWRKTSSCTIKIARPFLRQGDHRQIRRHPRIEGDPSMAQ